MLTQLRKKSEGFTIIEVLIVIAIAGLILLILFLAIPTLQRNSRNTRVRNDVSKAGGILQEIISNNNGTAPALAQNDPGIPNNSPLTPLAIAQAGYGQVSNINYNVSAAGFQALPNPLVRDTVYIRNYSVCIGAPAGAGQLGATGGSQRQFTMTFLVEQPGRNAAAAPVPNGFAAQCVTQ
jgi:prepilin-type N-terminal cleavage/methylation domain-containing protein